MLSGNCLYYSIRWSSCVLISNPPSIRERLTIGRLPVVSPSNGLIYHFVYNKIIKNGFGRKVVHFKFTYFTVVRDYRSQVPTPFANAYCMKPSTCIVARRGLWQFSRNLAIVFSPKNKKDLGNYYILIYARGLVVWTCHWESERIPSSILCGYLFRVWMCLWMLRGILDTR